MNNQSKKVSVRYAALEEKLLNGQKGCSGHPCRTDAEDKRIREKMDGLWWKMSMKERESVNTRRRKALRDNRRTVWTIPSR
jgi:hypothetical protein